MKAVINFIISQELELKDYPTLVKPLAKKFKIEKWLAEDIINDVIEWENSGTTDSLEKVLKKKYNLPFY